MIYTRGCQSGGASPAAGAEGCSKAKIEKKLSETKLRKKNSETHIIYRAVFIWDF